MQSEYGSLWSTQLQKMGRWMARRPVQVFADSDGNVFSAVNATFLPPVPVYRPWTGDGTDSMPLEANDVRKRNFLHDDHYFLVFTPENPRFFSHNTLLESLRYTKGAFPIEGTPGDYHVSLDLQQRWTALEHLLFQVIPLLHKYSRLTSFPLYLQIPQPHRHGYLKHFSKSHTVQRAAYATRESFLALLSYVAYVVSYAGFIENYPRETSTYPTLSRGRAWLSYLHDNGVPTLMVDFLSLSTITGSVDYDPASPRIGTFIHPYNDGGWNDQWHREVKHIADMGIPLWFAFGKVTSAPSNVRPEFVDYIPTTEQIQSALAGALATPVSDMEGIVEESSESMQTSTHTNHAWKLDRLERLRTEEQYPESAPRSGQLRGESWKAFFARRKARNEAAKETESDQQTRLRRKLENDGPAGQRMPGKRSQTRIFYWERVAEPAGYRLRIPISKAQWQDCWSDRNGQRVYDEYTDTWDICSEFGPDEARWDHDDDDDDDDDFAGVAWLGLPNAADIEPTARGLSPAASEKSAVQGVDAEPHMPEISNAHAVSVLVADGAQAAAPSSDWLTAEDLNDTLLFRYGLQPHPDLVALESTSSSPVTDKALACLALRRTAVTQSQAQALQQLSLHSPRIPSGADLQRIKPPNANARIRVRSYDTNVWDLWGVRSGFCYEVRSSVSGDVDWQLMVSDPVSAVQILRQGWGPEKGSIARELLKRGIAFQTFRHRRDEQTQYHEYREWRNVGLGKWRCSMGGLAIDFYGYVQARNNFLQETYACRAALLQGGIVWRLAMDALGLDYAVQEVLSGPSQGVEQFGGIPSFIDGEELWDDALSDAETDLICGVYQRDTGVFYHFRAAYIQCIITLQALQTKPPMCRGGRSILFGRHLVLLLDTGQRNVKAGTSLVVRRLWPMMRTPENSGAPLSGEML